MKIFKYTAYLIIIAGVFYFISNWKILSLTLMTGSHLAALNYEYDHTCFGSHTYSCVYMADELRIAEIKNVIKKISEKKQAIVSKIGVAGYNKLVYEGESKISEIHKQEPSWFMRLFFGDDDDVLRNVHRW